MEDGVSVPIYATLEYPRCRKEDHIIVELMDIRAADSLRIEYDFERDGWVIKQARRCSWADDEPIDEQWTEVAFIDSWAIMEYVEGEVESHGGIPICSICKSEGHWNEGRFICTNGHSNGTALEKEEIS